MKKQRILLIFCLLSVLTLSSFKAFSFHDSIATNNQIQSDNRLSLQKNYSNALKITPLKVIGLVNASFELCYERKTSEKFATQLTAAYVLPSLTMNNYRDFSDAKGFRVAIEEKIFITFFDEVFPSYVSFELNYLNQEYRSTWDYIDGNSIQNYYETTYIDTIRVHKQTYSLNLKLGYQKVFAKRFVVDVYFGIGLKYRDVYHSERANPNDKEVKPRHINLYYESNREGKSLTISMPINIRFGFVF